MWAKPKLDLSPYMLLLMALLWFFDGQGLFAAFLPAAAAHELGHILALRMQGKRLKRIKLSCFGLELDYFGSLEGVQGLLPILAGPFFGLLWSALAAFIPGEYWHLACGAGLAVNLVNLLPVLPLDGGRALLQLQGEKGRGVLRVFALSLAGACLLLAWGCRSIPPAVFAAGIIACNFGESLCFEKK